MKDYLDLLVRAHIQLGGAIMVVWENVNNSLGRRAETVRRLSIITECATEGVKPQTGGTWLTDVPGSRHYGVNQADSRVSNSPAGRQMRGLVARFRRGL
ncbi:hypothetical protein ACIQMR_35785 [Streptomyces sp. NPDC091376]|uniref:hypothetical protein n=1 Tax=Streptomyces sp. NPDC091376 TaxID=3365994 RepID=UPI00380D0416